jgi:hypothetical protein
MTRNLASGIVVATALLAACASSPEPVPVTGAPVEIYALAGQWSGTYTSPTLGRSGTIEFNLDAGRDTAFGDVTMVPRGWTRPLRPMDDPVADARDAPAPRVLTIAFVRVEDGVVSGTMEPYRDPDCGCGVYTTFTGEVGGNEIEGTFLSRHADGYRYTGTWRVERKKGGPPGSHPGEDRIE